MNDLNSYIDTTRKFTAPTDAIQTLDRSAQVNIATEIAHRAAQQEQPPPPRQMTPIVPVAN